MELNYKHYMITVLLILLHSKTSIHPVAHLYGLNPLLKSILQIIVVGHLASALLFHDKELSTYRV